MEQREARIKVIIDAAQAAAAVPGSAPSVVPGGVSAPRTVAPDAPGAAPGGVPGTSPGQSPAYAPAVAPGGGFAPSAPGSGPGGPYSPGTNDTTPTATSESGQSASRRGGPSALSVAASQGKALGLASIGRGGNLSDAVVDAISAVPIIGASARGTFKAAQFAKEYGPFLGGAVDEFTGTSTVSRFALGVSETISGAENTLNSFGAAAQATARLAASQVVFNRVNGTNSVAVEDAQLEALGKAFTRERKVFTTLSDFEERKGAIGRARDGRAIPSEAQAGITMVMDQVKALLSGGLVTGSRQ